MSSGTEVEQREKTVDGLVDGRKSVYKGQNCKVYSTESFIGWIYRYI